MGLTKASLTRTPTRSFRRSGAVSLTKASEKRVRRALEVRKSQQIAVS